MLSNINFTSLNSFDKKEIYLPNITWGNHIPIMNNAGLKIKRYEYYNDSYKCIEINRLISSINKAPNNSIFLFHVCAHNPTGVDPTKEEWKTIYNAMTNKNHIIFFDCAYQGFASGNHHNDAYPIRLFSKYKTYFF